MKLMLAGVLVFIILVAAGQVLRKMIDQKFEELLKDWSL